MLPTTPYFDPSLSHTEHAAHTQCCLQPTYYSIPQLPPLRRDATHSVRLSAIATKHHLAICKVTICEAQKEQRTQRYKSQITKKRRISSDKDSDSSSDSNSDIDKEEKEGSEYGSNMDTEAEHLNEIIEKFKGGATDIESW